MYFLERFVFIFNSSGFVKGNTTHIVISQAYEWVLHKAQQLEWSENAAKALVVIGDAVPHAVSYTDQKINWHTELDVLRGMGIKVSVLLKLSSFSI